METSDHSLEPLPYHVDLRDYLKSQERELWNWFASARAQADYTENLRMDLLKSTYRLDAESHPELYQGVEEAKARLQLDRIVLTQTRRFTSFRARVTWCFPGRF